MQQTASKLLKKSAEAVMKLAQSLYEGGFITYHRTDSTEFSEEALLALGEFIEGAYGPEYHRTKQYVTEAGDAQEAHEAIRPTNVALVHLPDEIDRHQQALYQIIWKRAMASQMSPAVFATLKVRLDISERPDAHYLGSGEERIFDGFQVLYKAPEACKHLTALRGLEVDQVVEAVKIEARQGVTKPRPRFTEATLLKELEAKEIGRPATYASMIAKVQERGYVEKGDCPGQKVPMAILTLSGEGVQETSKEVTLGAEKGKLLPTELGQAVVSYLLEHFGTIMDYKFTAKMERELDRITTGRRAWKEVVDQFYSAFHPTVDALLATLPPLRPAEDRRRKVGTHTSGRPMYAFTSRKGKHLLQIGDDEPTFVELTAKQVKGITEEQANALEVFPKCLGRADPTSGEVGKGAPVMLRKGAYGLYLTHGDRKCSVKGDPPTSLEEALELLAAKPKSKVIKKVSSAVIMEGEHGPFVLYKGSIKSVPEGIVPSKMTFKQCKALFE